MAFTDIPILALRQPSASPDDPLVRIEAYTSRGARTLHQPTELVAH